MRARRLLICCNGSSVEAEGRSLISCVRPVLRSEIAIVGERMEVFTSEPDVQVSRRALDRMVVGVRPLGNLARPLPVRWTAGGR